MTIQELFENMMKKLGKGISNTNGSNYITKSHISESKRIVKRKMANESRKKNRR